MITLRILTLAAIVGSACGGSSPTVPGTPAQGGQATATPAPAPSPGPPPIQSGPYSVSGTLTEDARPIGGANVSAWINQGSSGYSYMWAHGPLLTDAAGRYRLTGLPAGVGVWLQVWKAGYVQQCAAQQVTLQGDTTIDALLVSKENITASEPRSAPQGMRVLSGPIVEMTAGGKQPVTGAFVDFEPIMDFPAAITYSDQAGRFALCGLPQSTLDIGASIGNAAGNRVAWVSVPAGQNQVEILLP